MGKHTASPLETVLHNGRYYLLACYDSDKIYSFRVDLITDIRQTAEPARRGVPALKSFQRDAFMLQHPVIYAGQIRRFTLRVRKDSLTQIVDAFSDAVTIVPAARRKILPISGWMPAPGYRKDTPGAFGLGGYRV